jgi:hypothetical protein
MTIKITRRSPFSGKIHTKELDITSSQIADYDNGMLVQDAFPNLDAGDREFFHTGITDEEWDAQFPDV